MGTGSKSQAGTKSREPSHGNQVEVRQDAISQQPALRPKKQPQINVRGNSRDPLRGSYCTPKWLADVMGPFDLDPFSNPRSHIRAERACMLEDGGDGFGDGTPGSFRSGAHGELQRTTADSCVWLQPDYQVALRALGHYACTRWVALLRFDPRTRWFDLVYGAAELVAVIRHDPDGRPFGFEAPPGIETSSNTFPHALYARCAEDIPDEALRFCCAWRKRPTT